MATIRDIRERIASVRRMAQLTKAMEMVATARMKYTQEQVQALRPYSRRAWDILSHLASMGNDEGSTHPLFTPREVRNIKVLVIGANRGLCGSFDADITRVAEDLIRRQSVPVRIVTVGRRIGAWAVSTGQEVIAEFPQIPPQPTLGDVRPIARVLVDGYMEGRVDLVYLVGTRFFSIADQRPMAWQLLPVAVIGRAPERAVEYICEPDIRTIMGEILPRFIHLQIYEAILESMASEYCARMMAMRKANDNANELIHDLTLLYNKTRQRTITEEILDVIGGASVLAVGASP